MRRNKVYQAANNGKTKCTGQCSEHIQPPEFAMAQAKCGLPLRDRCGYEIRLSKTGKVREREATRDPTEVVPNECEHGAVI